MANRYFRGDAPAVAQVWRVKPPLIAGVVTLRVGNKTLTFDAWDAAAIAAGWNASKWPETRGITAAVEGLDVTFTSKTAGVPFWIWITVGSSGLGDGTGQNTKFYIALVNAPTGGTFNYAWGGSNANIPYNESAAAFKTALEGLTSIGAGNVDVTGSAGGPWTVEMKARFAGQSLDAPVLDGTNLTGGNAQAVINTLQNGATGSGGSVTEHYTNAAAILVPDSGTLIWDQADIQMGHFDPGTSPPYFLHPVIRFPLARPQGSEITAASITLHPEGGASGADIHVTVYVEDADDPSFPTSAADALSRPLMAGGITFVVPASDDPVVITGLAPLVQAVVDRSGWASGQHIQFHIRVSAAENIRTFFIDGPYSTGPDLNVTYSGAIREVQTIELSGNPRSGTVTPHVNGYDTAALAWNSTAATIQAAMEATTGVGAGKVVCTGGPWPARVTCSFDPSLGNIPQMTATDTLVNGDVAVSTLQEGSPDIPLVEDQRSRGPNHVDDPLNWDDGTGALGVPERNDAAFLPDGKSEVLYGLRQRTTFTASPTTDRLRLAGGQIGLWEDQAVEVLNVGGGLPAGLAANTTYYIRDYDGFYCRLSATRGGAAIDITSAGTGTHYIGVRVASLIPDSRFTGKLGLPRNNKDGYVEYRPRFWELWADAVTIAPGPGSGPGRFNLDTSLKPVSYQQRKTQGGTDGAPAAQLICAGSGNAIEILGGEFGLAIDADESGAFDSLKQRAGSVVIGPNVACGPIESTGGALRLLGCEINGAVCTP